MKRRTIKEETRYFLRSTGHQATDQDIQRAIWRERKYSRTITGWSIYSYLTHNKIAKAVTPGIPTRSD